MFYTILGALLILLIIILIYAWYLGIFLKIAISEEQLGPLKIVYTEI